MTLCRHCRTALDYAGQTHPCLSPFEKWKADLDLKLQTHPYTGGMGLDDLPDLVDLWGLYRAGVLPADAATEVIAACQNDF